MTLSAAAARTTFHIRCFSRPLTRVLTHSCCLPLLLCSYFFHPAEEDAGGLARPAAQETPPGPAGSWRQARTDVFPGNGVWGAGVRYPRTEGAGEQSRAVGMTDTLGLWLGSGRNGGRAGSARHEAEGVARSQRSGLDHTFNCFQAISIMRTQIVPLGIQPFQRWRKRLWSIRVKKLVASTRRVNVS